jgi:hypothetical protein
MSHSTRCFPRPSRHAKEIDLLLCAAQVMLTSAQASHLIDLARPEVDWDFVTRAAVRHGIVPLLHANLHTLPAVPAAVRQQLHARAQANAARSLLLTAELLQLLQLFTTHTVSALAFKGPTLAAQVYGNIALREFGDLDLLVTEAHLPRAKSLLLERGYRVEYALSPRQEAAYVRTICQLPLRRDDGCVVELHTALAPRAFAFPLDAAQLWKRRVPVCLLGQIVAAPSPEDLLIILCMHGAKHRWNNLGWICDVAELLRAYPGIDWSATLRRARAVRSRRMLYLGLDLARRALGVSLSKEAEEQVQTDPVIATLARRVCGGLFQDEEGQPKGLASALFHLRVRERLGDGIRYGISLALEPTPADWSEEGGPEWLPFANYLRRLRRLVGKYACAVYRQLILHLFRRKRAQGKAGAPG